MDSTAVRTIRMLVCTAILVVVSRPSNADNLQRIRTTSTYLQATLAAATEKSPTLRSIIDRIDASNVIVYVTCDRFESVMLNGKTLWADANHEARYLRVKIDCMLSQGSVLPILGHELQHVAEVADAADVVNAGSFAKLFRTIGYSTCDRGTTEQFETVGAITAGERVRQEVLSRWTVRARVVANARSGVPMQ